MLRVPTILRSPPKKKFVPRAKVLQTLAVQWSAAAEAVNAAGLTITDTISKNRNALPTDLDFTYIENKYIFDTDVKKPNAALMVSCTCMGSCKSGQCDCVAASDINDSHNVLSTPYTQQNKLAIRVPRGFEVNECNASCHCDVDTCRNRGSQYARHFVLDIFHKPDFSWGVRTTSRISSKSIIGIHTGLLVKRSKSFSDKDAFYCFNLDHDEAIGDSKALLPNHELFTVFSKEHGNWSRFLAHSENPNVDQFVAVHDVPTGYGMPFIIFYAKNSLPAYTELTLDYRNGIPPTSAKISPSIPSTSSTVDTVENNDDNMDIDSLSEEL